MYKVSPFSTLSPSVKSLCFISPLTFELIITLVDSIVPDASILLFESELHPIIIRDKTNNAYLIFFIYLLQYLNF